MRKRPPRNWSIYISTMALIISASSLIVSIYTNYLSERAYVFAQANSAFNISAGGGIPQAYVRVDNSGKTLARITSRKVGVTITTTLPERLEDLGEMTSEPGKFVAWPNQPNFIIRSPSPSVQLTDSDIEKLNRAELKIYVFGKIEYEDIFHMSHETTFCHMYFGSETANLPPYFGRGYHATQAKYCDKFNSAD